MLPSASRLTVMDRGLRVMVAAWRSPLRHVLFLTERLDKAQTATGKRYKLSNSATPIQLVRKKV